MATSAETLQLILTADDKGSPVIRQVGASAADLKAQVQQAAPKMEELGRSIEGVGGAGRALKAGLSQVIEQVGIGGPAAHVAAFAFLHSAEGLTAMTGAAVGAGIGLTALVSSLKFMSEEKSTFDKAFRTENVEFFVDSMEKLENSISSRQGVLGHIATPFIMLMGALQGTNDVLMNSKLTEKLMQMQNAFDVISTNKAKHALVELNAQAELVSAGPLVKVEIEYEQAVVKTIQAANAKKISIVEMKSILQGLNEVHEESIKKAQREIDAIGQYSQAVQKNVDLQMQLQLVSAQGKGDTAAVEAITRQRDALKENFQLNIQLSEQQEKLNLQKQQFAQFEQEGNAKAAALAEIEIGATERRMGLINQEISLQNQLRTARDNALKVADPSRALAAIEAAISQAFKSGNKPTQDMVKEWQTGLDQVQRNAFRTFGVNVPTDVQQTIDKVEALIKKVAEAAGIDTKTLEDKLKSAFGGDHYAGLGPQSSLLANIFFEEKNIKGEFEGIVDLTEAWKENVLGTKGAFTNLVGPTDKDMLALVKNTSSTADASKAFGGSITTNTGLVGTLNEALNNTLRIVAEINAQGGVKVVQ